MVRFACTSCNTIIDTDRDRVRVPRAAAGPSLGPETTEYTCARCGAFHALRLRPIGVFAYVAAMPVLALALMSYAPALATRTGEWLGRVAFRPIQTTPPRHAIAPEPRHG